jgi:hypothetical protein
MLELEKQWQTRRYSRKPSPQTYHFHAGETPSKAGCRKGIGHKDYAQLTKQWNKGGITVLRFLLCRTRGVFPNRRSNEKRGGITGRRSLLSTMLSFFAIFISLQHFGIIKIKILKSLFCFRKFFKKPSNFKNSGLGII